MDQWSGSGTGRQEHSQYHNHCCWKSKKVEKQSPQWKHQGRVSEREIPSSNIYWNKSNIIMGYDANNYRQKKRGESHFLKKE